MSKKRFDINKYKDPEFSMCCDTKEKANTFLKYLDSVGRKWSAGGSYIEHDGWSQFGSNSYYFFNKGVVSYMSSDKKDGVTLLFDMFDWSENDSIKAPKIKVSKWFDEYMKKYDKPEMVTEIGICANHNQYWAYSLGNSFFEEEEFNEIKKDYKKYLRALLDGYEVEVEEEKTPLGWIPEEGEKYWNVISSGKVFSDRNGSEFDIDVFKYTRVFKTKEEAEFEAEKMKVTRKLEKYACEFKQREDNYYIYLDFALNPIYLKVANDRWEQMSNLYFDSEEKAKEAIDAVGEDRILKYYFGVENE